MRLTEVIIDGFKSYAVRTVISGWDAQFNAITGLNGSGKSNILDAICFVLGITNLSHVRAGSLQDLIYKQGQAGVTKATVTLVFDNSDPSKSPVGQELCETITVTRQIVLGGRNKYQINGHTVEANKVADMFQSVSLNVNNPHFLIMQGRITKVLNMKPPEILGLIEEAAGTRMFEAKKQAALKVIEKKQAKVGEIGKVLDEEITPQLKKLRDERAAYLKWAANNTERERLAKFCVAWEFTTVEATRSAAGAAIGAAQELVKVDIARRTAARAEADAKGREILAQQNRLAASRGGEFNALNETESRLGRELAAAAAAHKHRAWAAGEEERAAAAAEKALRDADAGMGAAASALARQRGEAETAVRNATALAAEVSTLRARLTAVTAGMSASGDAGAGSTVTDQLIAARARAAALRGEIASRELKAKHSRSVAKEALAAVKAAEADAAGLSAALERAQAGAAARRAELARLGFDAAREEALRGERDALASRVASASEAVDAEWASLSAQVSFSFDAHGMGKDWDSSRVKGTVAELVRLGARPEAAGALEVLAGGRLFQVIVDTEVTGKALLEKGRLRKRVTLIPLNQIKPSLLSADRRAAAARIGGDGAVPALSLVGYPSEVLRAMEYVFGSAFICDNSDIANAVCYNKAVLAKCVTLAGDVFDPAGTLEGGSSATGSGVPLLLRLAKAHEARDTLRGDNERLAAVERALAGSAAAARTHATLSEAAELAGTEATLLGQRLSASALGAHKSRLEAAQGEVAAEEEGIAAATSALAALVTRIKDLEAEVKNASAAREGRIAAAEGDLAKALKASTAAEVLAKKLQHSWESAQAESEAAGVERSALASAAAERTESAARLAKDAAAARATLDRLNEEHAAASARLAAAKEAISTADKAVRGLNKEKEAAIAAAEEADAAVKKGEANVAAVKREAKNAETRVANLLERHPWVAVERQFFASPNSDYDFSAKDPVQVAARLAEVEKQQGELERRINKKVMGMIDAAEREYHDLRTKKGIIENDKAKIEKVITELDEKKNEALRSTWAKVNKDFGSIFSTLLPGTTAKLQPTDSGDVLDGLEVRVAFNSVWKESLTELSGGQRSLLALSLILSLLLFKPAPLYILDEVDAALDLSHTQNIGHMIKTHFSNSQFIVVSLKQGMFSNANVLFRTKFVEGTSTVLRTVAAAGGAPRAALRDAEEEEGAGAAGKGAGAGAGVGRKGAAAAAGDAGL